MRRFCLLIAMLGLLGVAAASASADGLPSGRTSYRSLDDYNAGISALADAHPDIARRIVLPHRSVQGREIAGLEIAAGVGDSGDGRPVFLVVGLTHAREWSSGEIAMEYAQKLIRDRASPRIARLLATSRTIVVPVVNPDGFVATMGGAPSHRTNCRAVGPLERQGSSCTQLGGVDLNRNFGAFWGGPGASPTPGDDTYRGTGPWSEPESMNIHELSQGRPITGVVSLHNIAGLVLSQPGFSSIGTLPDKPRLSALGDAMARVTGYQSGDASQLEDITGALEDWNYYAQGAFGYTIELGGGSSDADFEGAFSSHVLDQWSGVGQALLLAGEEAASPTDHVVLSGTAPPGTALTLTHTFQTQTSPVCQDEGCLSPAAPLSLSDGVSYSLTVPASGRFVWDVGPSTRPLTGRGGGHEGYTLACGNVTHQVVADRGQSVSVQPCAAGSPVSVSGTSTVGTPAAGTVAPLSLAIGRAVVRGGVSARGRCARACLLTVTATAGGKQVGTATAPVAAGVRATTRVALRNSAPRRLFKVSAVLRDDRGGVLRSSRRLRAPSRRRR